MVEAEDMTPSNPFIQGVILCFVRQRFQVEPRNRISRTLIYICIYVLKKTNYSFDPTTPLLGLYPKNLESTIQKNLGTSMFIAAQFTIAKCWKQPKCPSVNEWIKKLWYIYTMEYYTAERKKELLPFTTAWMELESIMLSEISQAVKDKHHVISPINGI